MRILCAGGGTLGSVSPLLAVVDELRRSNPNLETRWIGTYLGPEPALVEAAGISFSAISSGKLRRYGSFENVTDIGRLLVGFFQSLQFIGTWRPDVVLTAGSFVAVPVGWAAWLYRIPVMVHQLDLAPGLANKLLRPCAARVTVTFPGSLKDFPKALAVVTGNPVRATFLRPPSVAEARQQLGLELSLPVLTIVGGGTGADFINRLIVRNVSALTQLAQVVHVTGTGKQTDLPISTRYKAYSFSLNTLPLLQAADLVVTRAGMMFLSELAVLGKAVMCIPLPGHQEDNAAFLSKAQAAVVLAQPHLTDKVFIDTVRRLLADVSERERLGVALRSVFPVSAAASVAREVLAVLEPQTK